MQTRGNASRCPGIARGARRRAITLIEREPESTRRMRARYGAPGNGGGGGSLAGGKKNVKSPALVGEVSCRFEDFG